MDFCKNIGAITIIALIYDGITSFICLFLLCLVANFQNADFWLILSCAFQILLLLTYLMNIVSCFGKRNVTGYCGTYIRFFSIISKVIVLGFGVTMDVFGWLDGMSFAFDILGIVYCSMLSISLVLEYCLSRGYDWDNLTKVMRE